MSIDKLNNLDKNTFKIELLKCCGSENWANSLSEKQPFKSQSDLFLKSDEIWNNLNKTDFLDAFSQHPKIGDIDSLAKKFSNTKGWAENEQSGVNSANDEIIKELSEYNHNYEKKFGYIFIVYATGKSAKEMLDILKSRINNNQSDELKIACEEQNKITRLRLEKLNNQLI